MSNVSKLETVQSTIFDPIFNHLPYPLASGLVRGIKAFITIVMGAIIAAVADGSLFQDVHATNVLFIIAVVSPVIAAVDKWLRERGLENDPIDVPISLASNGPTDTITPPDTNVPTTDVTFDVHGEDKPL